jgi:hypothetical protein
MGSWLILGDPYGDDFIGLDLGLSFALLLL